MAIVWVLTDIEGTTSSVSFVHDVLFPYARQHLPGFLLSNQRETKVAAAIADVQQRTDAADLAAVTQQLLAWIDDDVKDTALKSLQGLVWYDGYVNGDYQAHVYADTVPELRRWRQAGRQIAVYSSGSIRAQELFFQYSEAGDVRDVFDHHFDTTTGPKRESTSYTAIAKHLGVAPVEVLFLSDIAAELDAAQAAGMRVCGLQREPEVDLRGAWPVASDFPAVTQLFPEVIVPN